MIEQHQQHQADSSKNMAYHPYQQHTAFDSTQQGMIPAFNPSFVSHHHHPPHLTSSGGNSAPTTVYPHDASYSTSGGSYFDMEFDADTSRQSPASDEGLSSDSAGTRPTPSKRGSAGSDALAIAEQQQPRKKTKSGRPKKPRITLARGGACVACRGRKLKCTGEQPCKTCQKANLECKYEEIQRKKPRAQLLEERVAELEAELAQRPPLSTTGSAHTSSSGSIPHLGHSSSLNLPAQGSSHSRRPSAGSETGSRVFMSPTVLSPDPLALGLTPGDRNVSTNRHTVTIPPHSPLELALIVVVLPHTPFLSVPIHPQRFLASLRLPVDHPDRPHPALLYVLFAEAVRILELAAPDPTVPTTASYHASGRPDAAAILPHVQGSSLDLIARARSELSVGISAVDRPFDLVRAATAIARHLYSLGRFIEGWNLPVMRLAVMCGLHRISNTIVPGPPSSTPVSEDPFLPPPNALPSQYAHAHRPKVSYDEHELPTLRMKPVILPPPRDWIELMERKQAFWAAKALDWAAGIGWGWSNSLADSECTTAWPLEWSETNPANANTDVSSIFDLYNPSIASVAVRNESTYTLAIKSLAILSRASSLFDLAIPTSTLLPDPSAQQHPHPFTLSALSALDTAMSHFQQTISPMYLDDPMTGYSGIDDPWWIMLHSNLYTTQMLISAEQALYAPSVYPLAVGSARNMAALMRRVPQTSWVHLDLIVAINMSLVARFLNKEANRMLQHGNESLALALREEAAALQLSLKNDLSPWMPMAGLHSMIVERVRDGWPEKEGEYERV